jgi:glycosyltransferase involved in cell wall biosynthesis
MHRPTSQLKNAPKISVVLCTRNRGGLLQRVLESFTSQDLSFQDFEIIVIDDGSTDETGTLAKQYVDRLPLTYAYQQHAGLAAAKNHGIYRARSEIILFADDDDIAHEKLLSEHLETHRKYPQPNYAVLGFTQVTPAIARKPLMHFVTQIGCHLLSYPNIKHGDILDWTYFWGGRSSCKREFLMEHGVFNQVFRFGCEDMELGWRLSQQGLRVVYNADAVSTMIREINFDGFCRRVSRQGQSQYVFSKLHDDPVVRKYTEVEGSEDAWREIGQVFSSLLHSARMLDRLANAKLELGLTSDETTESLLHREYFAAFRACKLKGICKGRLEVARAANAGYRVYGVKPSFEAQLEDPTVFDASRDDSNHELGSLSANSEPSKDFKLATLSQIIHSPPKIHGGGTITWGLGEDVLNFMFKYLHAGLKTLETGCGASTLMFALKETTHFAITPSRDESERITGYCIERNLPTDKLSFRIGKSEDILPTFDVNDFDFVLIDGCHAFPVPFLDWYYTSQRLKVEGLLIIDDLQLWPCRVLCDFLTAEPEWAIESTFSRSMVFRKLRNIPSKEWTDQAFVVERSNRFGAL